MSGLAPNMYAALSITLTSAIAAVVMRICARRMTKMHLWFDDYLAVLALLFSLVFGITVIIWLAHYDLGRKIDLSDTNRAEHIRERSRLLLWIGSFSYATAIACAKLSILSMYWRLFQFTSVRYPIITIVVLVSIWYILRCFMVIFQCVPVQAYWDKKIQNAHCRINGAKFFLATVLTHSLMDLIILTLPIIEVSRMRLPFGQKLAVYLLFASGSLVFIASVFIVIQSARFDPKSQQLPYDVAYNIMAATVEVNLALVSGSLPILRPIFRKLVPGLSTFGSNQHVTMPSLVVRLPSSPKPTSDHADVAGSGSRIGRSKSLTFIDPHFGIDLKRFRSCPGGPPG